MAAELIDIGRMAVTDETDHWLKVVCAETGESKQQILRDLAHAHAVKELDKIDERARLKAAFSVSNGHETDIARKARRT